VGGLLFSCAALPGARPARRHRAAPDQRRATRTGHILGSWFLISGRLARGGPFLARRKAACMPEARIVRRILEFLASYRETMGIGLLGLSWLAAGLFWF